MRFDWTPEQDSAYHATLKAVRESFAEPRPEAGYFSRKDWLRLGELGLLGLSIPAEFGGGGLRRAGHRAPGRGSSAAARTGHRPGVRRERAPVRLRDAVGDGFGSEPAKRRFLPGHGVRRADRRQRD